MSYTKQRKSSFRAEINQGTALLWVMLLIMLGFSVTLAAAILFNTANLNILERQRELATLRAMGQQMSHITAMLTLENSILAFFGLLLGVPASILAAKEVLTFYTSDLFSLPFALSGWTLASSLFGVVVVLLVAQWPGLRRVSRLNLAEVVRNREG